MSAAVHRPLSSPLPSSATCHEAAKQPLVLPLAFCLPTYNPFLAKNSTRSTTRQE